MAIETIAEYSEPNPGRDDPAVRADVPAGPTLDASATAAVRQLLDEHPEIAREIRELLRTRVQLEEVTRRGEETKKAAAEAEQR